MTIHLEFKFNILEEEIVYVIFGLSFEVMENAIPKYIFYLVLNQSVPLKYKKKKHNLCNANILPAILSTITPHFPVRHEFSNCGVLSYDNV